MAAKAAKFATPLLLCTAVIELSDVMFAFDSVPAVIAVSQEPLIVYSSMMFAILGLRTMYFVLEGAERVPGAFRESSSGTVVLYCRQTGIKLI